MAVDKTLRRFRCPNCKQYYGDPWYHGPIGHAPQQLCFDCWVNEWDTMNGVMLRGGNWRPLDAALFLLCQGFSHQEAATLIGVRRKTVYNWIRTLKRKPHLAPEWLLERAASRQVARTA